MDSERTQISSDLDCLIVGGGPAGMVLAYLMGRAGLRATLLESHANFDRDFRGDTVHPSTLDLFDTLGLVDKLLAQAQGKLRAMRIAVGNETFRAIDLSLLSIRYPYIALVPQARLLDLLAGECLNTSVAVQRSTAARRLLWENDRCLGVEADGPQGRVEYRARLTVAADGRASLLRKLANLELKKSSPPMDVLWFRVPRQPGDPAFSEEGIFRVTPGKLSLSFPRNDDWQCAYIIPKNGFHAIKEHGIARFQHDLQEGLPEFADRAHTIDSWAKVAVLSVESAQLPTWHRRGLLFIGDSAHPMSPVGGVGINYAIQDAVESANRLIPALREARSTGAEIGADLLQSIQRRRQGPVRFMQFVQRQLQQRLVVEALDATRPFKPPVPMHWRWFRRILARQIAYGWRPSRLDASLIQ